MRPSDGFTEMQKTLAMKMGSSPSPTRKHVEVMENDIDLDVLPSARIEHNVDGGLNFNSIDEE